MSDDKNLRNGSDRELISLGEDYEVRHWTEKFGVSRAELEAAVKAVGHNATAVENHLRARR